MKRPMIAAAILAACLSVILINADFKFAVSLSVIIGALFILSLCLKKFRVFSVIFAVALLILANFFIITVNKIEAVNKIDTQKTVTVSATVTSEYYLDNVAYYTLKTDSENTAVPSGINISVHSTFAPLNDGDKVECKLYIDPIPKESRANFYSKGVYAFGAVSSVIKTERPANLTSVLSDFRREVTKTFYKYLSSDVAASINAITVGDKYYLAPEFEEMVKRAGVSHVMVVSGMHLAIICGTFLKLLRFLKFGNKLSAVITGVFVFLFMALCGFSMSVLRAGITYFIMLFALFILKRGDALNSLCVAVSVIIIGNPFAVGSVAFQLSVLSTAGIIILSGPLANKIISLLHIRFKFLKGIIEMVCVTLSALFFTLPVTVYYFGGVSLVAVFTNLLIGQAVTAALIFSSAALPVVLLTDFSYLGKGLFVLTEYITRYFNAVINYFGALPWAYVSVKMDIIIICYLAIILSFGIIKYIDNIKRVVSRSADSIRAAVKGKS